MCTAASLQWSFPKGCGAAAAVIVHHCVLAEAVWNEGVPELLPINDIH